MTWDVYALRAPRGARRVEDLPDGFVPPAIGNPDEVVEVIRQAARHVDASDPRWLTLEAPDHSIEVALGKGVRVHDLTFYIRGGEGAVAVVLDVCRRLAVTPYDTETGEVLTATSQPPAPPPDEEPAEAQRRPWWRRLRRG